MLPSAIERNGQLAEQLQKQLIEGNTTPAPVTNQEPSPDPAPTQPEVNWEQKYNVLQGKFNAEVPRYAAEIRTLKDRITELENENASLKAQAAQPAPAAPVVTPEEEAQYGPDFIDVVRRVAASVAPKVDPSTLNSLQQEVSQVKQVTLQNARKDFFATLDTRAPSWTTLNSDTGFLSWLDEYDPLIGRKRQDAFDEAYSALDVERVAAFFNTFGGGRQQSRTERPSLESNLDLPPSGGSAPQTNVAGKKIWSRRDIQDFYTARRRGQINDAEFARGEQDLVAAQQEGRIRA